jgi:flagellin
VIGATGSYEVGDLDGKTIEILPGTGGSYQVGPTDSDFNRIEVAVRDMRATGNVLNLKDSNVSDFTGARSAITAIDEAIGEVSMQRGTLGAVQNRLAFTISYTENEIENIQASESSISDADIAAEVTAFTRAQILSQAATAMLAQANVVPQNALALLS